MEYDQDQIDDDDDDEQDADRYTVDDDGVLITCSDDMFECIWCYDWFYLTAYSYLCSLSISSFIYHALYTYSRPSLRTI